MKKLTAIILILSLAISLCACTKANDSAPSAPAAATPAPTAEAANAQAAEQPVQNITVMNFATPTAKEEADITFDEPIVVLDNDYAKITVTGKYAGLDATGVNQVYGYKAIVENKSDISLMISIPNNVVIDGFMLDDQAGFYSTVDRYAPKAKANTRFYIILDRVHALELNTIDDLKNVTANVQILYSTDGSSYQMSPDGSFPPQNSFPFINTIP